MTSHKRKCTFWQIKDILVSDTLMLMAIYNTTTQTRFYVNLRPVFRVAEQVKGHIESKCISKARLWWIIRDFL